MIGFRGMLCWRKQNNPHSISETPSMGRVGDLVEIGSCHEVVEVLEIPTPSPEARTGRIRHANGENVAVDYDTWVKLRQRALETSKQGKQPLFRGTLRA